MSLVYISGPYANTKLSETMFEVAKEKLVDAGHQTISPIEIKNRLQLRKGRPPRDEELSKKCVETLMECEAIYYLKTDDITEQSLLEQSIAEHCGIPQIEILYAGRK